MSNTNYIVDVRTTNGFSTPRIYRFHASTEAYGWKALGKCRKACGEKGEVIIQWSLTPVPSHED